MSYARVHPMVDCNARGEALSRALRARDVGLLGSYEPFAGKLLGVARNDRRGLGADLPVYDFGQPGAVREVKRALSALGLLQANAAFTPAADLALEVTWKELTDDDTWNAAAGQEFLLAMSRLSRNQGVVIGFMNPPYVQDGLPGGLPQPGINGLELLAAAANTKIGASAKLSLYEAWRSSVCSTCGEPPSTIAPDYPVLLTFDSGLRLVPPPQAPVALLATLAAADAAERDAWKATLAATTEPARAMASVEMKTTRAVRDKAAQAAIDASPMRTGATTVDEPFRDCLNRGGTWNTATRTCSGGTPDTATLLLAGGLVAAVGVGFWYSRRERGG